MERSQTKQRVEDLHFCLYQRPVHPELFAIQKVRRITHARYACEVWLLQLAHVVMVQFGDSVLTEVISEDPEALLKSGLAASFRFRGERDHTQTFENGMTYMASTQVERLTPQLFPATYRDYVHFGQTRGIFQVFDEGRTDGLAAFSFVDFDARDHEFHVHAYHVFPDELTLLKTQSIFELPRKGRVGTV